MTSIVLVDDHPILRQGLVSLMKTVKDFTVVGEAVDGTTALTMIDALRPDIAIIDVSMPGINGLDVAEELARRGVETKIIILTMLNDPATIASAVRANIAGFVPKDNLFDDLLYAIRAALSGQQFISPSVTKILHEHLANREKAMTSLTTREKEVLKLIVEGMTSRQIGQKLFISPNTVENHRERIMQKLDIHKNVDLVKYAIAHNL